MLNTQRKPKSLTILFLWFLLIYFPTYVLGRSNSLGQIVFFISYLVVISLVLLATQKSLYVRLPKNESISVLFIFSVIIFTFLLKIPYSTIPELINHSRFAFYLFVFLIVLNILSNSNISPKQMKKGVDLTIISLFVFNILHLIKPELVSLINNRPMWGFRGISVGGPFVWSYIFSFFLLPIFYIYLHLVLTKFSFRNLFALFFILSCLLLGQSKACYLALAFTLLNYTLISMVYKLDNRRKIYAGAFCFLIVIILTLSAFPSFFSGVIDGFISLLNGKSDASTSGRLRQINLAISSIKDANIIELLFGVGVPEEVIENAYFSYFYKYGLLGAGAIVLLYTYLFIISYKYLKYAIRNRYDSISLSIVLGFNAMTISLFIFSLGASPIDANKSSYFFFFSWALVLYIRRYNERKLFIRN